MARELGLNPKKFGKLANHHQEPWKRPLPDFIAALYVKRFGKPIPAVVKTIEELAAAALAKKRAKKTRKLIASQPPNEQGSVAQTDHGGGPMKPMTPRRGRAASWPRSSPCCGEARGRPLAI